MKQEPPQKLLDGHGHQAFLVLVGIVFPAESDLAIGEVNYPVVGDGDTMSVAGQIVDDMFRSSEWPFGVDDPVLAEQWPQKSMEGLLCGERLQAAGNSSFRWRKASLRPATNLPRNTRLSTFTGKKKG